MLSVPQAPCAACKCRRQKCTQECIFAPYFPPNDPQKFENVHKVFGASNVAKILHELPPDSRMDAVSALAYEAQYRIIDPVYGCVGYISFLQHRLHQIRSNLEMANIELATYLMPQNDNIGGVDFVAEYDHKFRMQPSYDFQSNLQYCPQQRGENVPIRHKE